MSIKFAQASLLKKGSYAMIDGAPCKVLSVTTSKPGKHGSAKARIEGVGLIDQKRRSMVCPGGDDIEVPIIDKKNAQVLSITGNIASVMDLETYESFTLEIDEDVEGEPKEGSVVVYWQILEHKLLKQVKSE